MFDVSACPPIDTSRNFPAYVSAEPPLNISPNLSEVLGTIGQLFKIPTLSTHISHRDGDRGGPHIFFDWNAHIFVT
jgi:hypothetical protein